MGMIGAFIASILWSFFGIPAAIVCFVLSFTKSYKKQRVKLFTIALIGNLGLILIVALKLAYP